MNTVTHVAVAVLRRADGRILLGRRAANTVFPGFWELPGGKIEAGETPRAALHRELQEELGITVLEASPWLTREHALAHARVRLHFFRVQAWADECIAHVHDALSWELPEKPEVAPMLPANAPIFAALSLPMTMVITHAADIGVAMQLQRLSQILERTALPPLVYLREPSLSITARQDFYRQAAMLCRRYGARAVVNTEAALVSEISANGFSGIHWPEAQLMEMHHRPETPTNFLVGASCHSRQALEHAAHLQLDYAVLGHVAATATHAALPPLGWSRFADYVKDLPLPVYALGGLSAQDLSIAQTHGAHGIGMMRAAWA